LPPPSGISTSAIGVSLDVARDQTREEESYSGLAITINHQFGSFKDSYHSN